MELGHEYVFGEWDAPCTDDAERIDVPLRLRCMDCEERFVEGDNGMVQANGLARHRECSMRMVTGGIGHVVNHQKYCGGMGDPDAGLSRRVSSLLVWQDLHGHRVTENDLEAARALSRR